MRDAGAGERPGSGTPEPALAEETQTAHRSRLARKEETLRVWDLLQLFTPWLLLAISGFFAAYLLRPWPLGVLGVLANSVALNGSAILGWTDSSSEMLVEFILIVLGQTAAIGVGIVLSARSETEERKREELVERLEAALHENAGLHTQLVAQARESEVQDERQRLAGELHDTLAQGLAGTIPQLQVAERSAGVQGEAEEHVSRALRLARSSLTCPEGTASPRPQPCASEPRMPEC